MEYSSSGPRSREKCRTRVSQDEGEARVAKSLYETTQEEGRDEAGRGWKRLTRGELKLVAIKVARIGQSCHVFVCHCSQ